MKLAVLSLAVLAFACGKYEGVVPGSSLGQSRSFQPIVADSTLLNNVTSICSALTQKNSILNSAVNSVHNFDASQTNCDGTMLSTGIVKTTIQNIGSEYQFRKDDGTSFIFPNVETNTSGIMSSFCSNLSNLQNQTVSSDNIVTSITTSGISSADCSPVAGEICVLIETGPLSGTAFTVTTQEWIRFRVSNSTGQKIGFFTQRKKVSRSFCGTNQSIEYRATLK
ncbi:hypothetical protein ACJVC5_17295 [Peredibacter sp. HCB2-198]|uniref:hypothetical protein n=1 Tax=Peredibacter sp. HCB2-198 TaxID=3383025 RepID=UPI0038B6AAC0